MALAEAQLDLRRIRDTKLASTPVVIDEMLDPRALFARLIATRGRRKLAIRQLEELAPTSS
jgi:hypothetical protein